MKGISDAVGTAFRWRRTSVGLLAVLVGSLILSPCLPFFATFFWLGEPVEATVVERYYDLEPRYTEPPTGDWPVLTWFNATSTAVVEYRAGGETFRTTLRNPRKEVALVGVLDDAVPTPRLEVRLPAGELRRFPQADALRATVDAPVQHLGHAWTGAAKPPQLVFDRDDPARAILLRGSVLAVAAAALPAALMGIVFIVAGMLRIEARTRAGRLAKLALLTLPLWVAPATRAAMPAVDDRSNAALRVIDMLARAPETSLRLFGVVIGEPVTDLPADVIRFADDASPYREAWQRANLERPHDCCADGVVAVERAAAQLRDRIATDPGLAAELALLSQAGHDGFDVLLQLEP